MDMRHRVEDKSDQPAAGEGPHGTSADKSGNLSIESLVDQTVLHRLDGKLKEVAIEVTIGDLADQSHETSQSRRENAHLSGFTRPVVTIVAERASSRTSDS